MGSDVRLISPNSPRGGWGSTPASINGWSVTTPITDVSGGSRDDSNLLEDGEVEEYIEIESGSDLKSQSLDPSYAQLPSNLNTDLGDKQCASLVSNLLEITQDLSSGKSGKELEEYLKKISSNLDNSTIDQKAIMDLVESTPELKNLLEPIIQAFNGTNEVFWSEQGPQTQSSLPSSVTERSWSNNGNTKKNKRFRAVKLSLLTDKESSFSDPINRQPYSYNPKKKLKVKWKPDSNTRIAASNVNKFQNLKGKLRFKQDITTEVNSGDYLNDNVDLSLVQNIYKVPTELPSNHTFQHNKVPNDDHRQNALDIIPQIESLLNLVSNTDAQNQLDAQTYKDISEYLQTTLNSYPQDSGQVQPLLNQHQSIIISAAAPSLESATILDNIDFVFAKEPKPLVPRDNSPEQVSVADKLSKIFGFPPKDIHFFLDPDISDTSYSHQNDVAINTNVQDTFSTTQCPKKPIQSTFITPEHPNNLSQLPNKDIPKLSALKHFNTLSVDNSVFTTSKNKLAKQIAKINWRNNDTIESNKDLNYADSGTQVKNRLHTELKRRVKLNEAKIQLTTQKKRKPVCKFAKSGSCLLGSKCSYSHVLKDQPCIFYHFKRHKGGCAAKGKCPYSHEAITGEQLADLFEEQKRWEQREVYKDQIRERRARIYNDNLLKLSNQLQNVKRDSRSHTYKNNTRRNDTFGVSQNQQLHTSVPMVSSNVNQNPQLHDTLMDEWNAQQPDAIQNFCGMPEFSIQDNSSYNHTNQAPHLISQILMASPQNQTPHQDNAFSCFNILGDDNRNVNYNSNSRTSQISSGVNPILPHRDRAAQII